MRRDFNRLTLAAVVVSLLVVGGLQAQTTTGRIIGTVIEGDGQPLPGVTVTIGSPALIGGEQSSLTDGDGRFQFLSLHPGAYTVRADLNGYVSQERQDVKVSLGGAAALRIAMLQGRFESEIEVVSETPVVDPTQVNTEQIFDLGYMQQSAVGSANRDYLRIIGQAPGVTGGDNPNVFGSTLSENAYFIDGLDITDPLTGTWGTLYNYDAIAEVEIQTSGFEAEYGRATGGLISVLTKSGGNRFSGTLDIRYRDNRFQESGAHYDAENLDTSFQDFAATLGGPIVRDKLWFFAAYERVNSEETPVNSATTREFEGQNYNLKLTWQAAARWRLLGRVSGDPAEIANDNASEFVAPEATSRQKQGADVLAFELSGLLSHSVVWNSVAGVYRSQLDLLPMSGDLETASHFNSGTFMTTRNFRNQQYTERTRKDLATDFTVFLGNLAGSHEVKVGLQYSETEFPGANCLTGTEGGACSRGSVGFAYDDLGMTDEFGNLLFTLPFSMTESRTAGEQNYTGQLSTAYLQDSWRVLSNLTFKIGLRYDEVNYENNAERQIADMSRVQPRIGVAWDITNDARNVLRANWGRFMHPATLSLPSILRVGNEPSYTWSSCSTFLPALGFNDPTQCEFIASLLGFQYRADDPDGMDLFGWFLLPGNVRGIDETLVQPDLRATYADTLSLSYEREVGPRSSIELTYVDKKTRDIFEDTCAGNYPVPEEGADCSQLLLGNLPGLARDYQGFILRYETRSLSWLTLLASYTYSKSEGNIGFSQGANPDFDYYPWSFDNRYGYLEDHRAHRFKLNGFFLFPYDFTFAFDGYYSSAFTWEPRATFFDDPQIPPGIFYFLEPRGSRDASDAYNLDLQLSKGFTFGDRVRLLLIGSVYNTFSSENPTAVCNLASGCGGYDAGDALAWTLPRSYEIGFRVEF